MSFKGIDVSEWQGNINWVKVKPQIDFAILKLGNIGDGNKFWVDPYFETNYNQCKNLGIPIGVYVYSYTNELTNIDECARAVVNYLQGKKLELPVYIDMEDAEIAVEGKDKLTQLVIEFNTIIEQAGIWAGVYANLNWFTNYLNKSALVPRYTSWIAHPENANNLDKYKGQYDMFQYSFKGKVDGINGNVDMDYMYRDLIAEINGGSKPEPTPTPTKSIDELANEVINGQWGNGQERIDRLTAAGYDYNAVQNRVNEILGADNKQYYTIQYGDTLSGIAAKFGTTVTQLCNWNNISNPNRIYAGNTIRVK